MTIRLRMIALAALAAALAAPGCGGDSTSGDDTAADVPIDTGDAVDVPDPGDVVETTDPGEDTPEDVPEDVPEETPEDDAGDAGPEDVGPEDVPSEADIGPGTCGNGSVESGEVCDDGNTDMEACDTTDPAACLADCSLLMAECGDGDPDPGEQCDDGNADSYDACTTSCTINNRNIGDPCRCTARCSDLDPTAGTIVGCENVEVPPDGSALLACARSINSSFPPMTLHSAEGYCTLMAMSCTGSPFICRMAPVIGNVDAFECPAGFHETTDVQTVVGATLTIKLCGLICDSHNDCRWNAVEQPGSPFAGQCGQWRCLEDTDTGVFVCEDPRNSTP